MHHFTAATSAILTAVILAQASGAHKRQVFDLSDISPPPIHYDDALPAFTPLENPYSIDLGNLGLSGDSSDDSTATESFTLLTNPYSVIIPTTSIAPSTTSAPPSTTATQTTASPSATQSDHQTTTSQAAAARCTGQAVGVVAAGVLAYQVFNLLETVF